MNACKIEPCLKVTQQPQGWAPGSGPVVLGPWFWAPGSGPVLLPGRCLPPAGRAGGPSLQRILVATLVLHDSVVLVLELQDLAAHLLI